MRLAGLQLADTAVTETFGILAVRGSGKTNTARCFAETFFKHKLPFVAVDPVGSWWGLRAARSGGKGLPIPIFGGRHGDVPLSRDGGELVADLVVEEGLSCVLDLTTFDSEGSKKKFLLDFARRLYSRNEHPLHLFLEEADDYIPQRPMRDEAQLLRAWENIVRRGRARGLGCTLITQRSASLNKNVLTQVQTLIAMRTTGPQDRAAIEAWVKYNDQSLAILKELPKLQTGEAWIWSPTFLDVTKKVRFPLSSTFDSGATPKPGARRKTATLADVDLKSLERRMAATIEKAKAEDPRLLRERVRELERELALSKKQQEVQIDPTVIHDLNTISSMLNDLVGMVGKLADGQRKPVIRQTVKVHRSKKFDGSLSSFDGFCADTLKKMPGGERRVLTVLAQHGTCTKNKLALLAIYAVNAGGFNNILSSLRTKGYIDGRGEISITETGLRALGTFEPVSGDVFEYWTSKLGKCEREILEALRSGRRMSKEEVARATATGYEPNGGGFNNALSRLRTLELISGRGELQIAEELTR